MPVTGEHSDSTDIGHYDRRPDHLPDGNERPVTVPCYNRYSL